MNETKALELVAQEVKDGRTRLHFKNISAKKLNGFVLRLSNQGQLEVDTSTGDRVIATGEVEDMTCADGTLEGNPITVAELQGGRSALKAELKRGLGLIVAEAELRDADTPRAFDRLESAILKLAPMAAAGNTHQANALRATKDDVGNVIEVMRNRQQRNPHLNLRELMRELRERIEGRIEGLIKPSSDNPR